MRNDLVRCVELVEPAEKQTPVTFQGSSLVLERVANIACRVSKKKHLWKGRRLRCQKRRHRFATSHQKGAKKSSRVFAAQSICIRWPEMPLRKTDLATHGINNGDTKSIRQTPRRLYLATEEQLEKMVEEIKEQGVIETWVFASSFSHSHYIKRVDHYDSL